MTGIKRISYKGRARTRRRKRKLAKVLFLLFIAAVLAGGAVGATYLSFWQIRTIEVFGVETISEREVMEIAENKISGKIFHIFPGRNILAAPLGLIEKEILFSFPKISAVEVSRSDLSALKVSIVERKPHALWCFEYPSSCFFIDENGYAFSEAEIFISGDYVVFEGSQETAAVGSQFIPSENFAKIDNFISSLKTFELNPSKARIENNDVSVTLRSGPRILFSLSSDIEKTLSNLESILSDNNLSLIEGGELGVEYIDLRFGNKIFYKLPQ
ncbi:MAG: hypothetical protein A2653_01630 [Candidatus Zambryskibacteria bacterium RIFCSPHIGHO2_01_FULL_43_25]|uniref:POTRA domain-containing protein n=1 Tax=Candidatus Zambryskibacteria bacterium RIFCSPLOWO2_01_FULL_45_21 TaxID=1802761 RepID=A0A1G2U2Z7_9BACT|nr:MAG: hypothetical protein A2653_01630 [Candidatus Zambryskibacteria bacterium RIFCSPHIGHO2_01_FULL_43_25]OHB00258.1 MAG: hypothetical protein A3E94_00770 [Candidatus Zambryskibacteria bacterium RIFCSPHIGHO2_12_FULL_44_12b]OHB03260.1 MAG: hypothetical protein A3B14_00600 [Candidatus Zambryskibacteria bacterium RIFCSPLOWO2_01_FULL_45_21]